MDGREVYGLAEGGSRRSSARCGTRKLRPERRRLAAHHEVLKRLMNEHTVLPMAFGLIAESDDDVRQILRLNRKAFVGQLDRVRGKVEMGVRVAWDVPNIFELFVTMHEELRALRDQMFRGGRLPSQDEKIELGRLFDRLLAADREECVDQVSSALNPECAELGLEQPPRTSTR